MKRNDLLLIVAVAVVAGIFSLVGSNVLFAPNKKELTAQKVDAINSDFQKPDPRYFNPEGINPTQLIQIGDNVNTQPF